MIDLKPYFETHDGSIQIFHADCRDVLPMIEPGSVDLVLTDPPYGLGDKWTGGGGSANTSWRFDPREARAWDQETIDAVLTLPTLGAPTIIWGGNYYALPPSRCWFLWDKKQNDDWTT